MLLALLGPGCLLEGMRESLFRQLLASSNEPLLVGFLHGEDWDDVVFGVGLVALPEESLVSNGTVYMQREMY